MIFVLLVAIVMAVGTWLLGWWAVPLIALIVGFMYRAEGGRGGRVALAAVVAWALLLVIDAIVGPFAALTVTVGGAIGIPGPALLVVTLLFPALLAWSAATAAAEVTRRSATRRPASLPENLTH